SSVTVALSPGAMTPVSNSQSMPVAVCSTSSRFVQRIVVPAGISMTAGWNVRSIIPTWTSDITGAGLPAVGGLAGWEDSSVGGGTSAASLPTSSDAPSTGAHSGATAKRAGEPSGATRTIAP